jgi:hypothetical protein
MGKTIVASTIIAAAILLSAAAMIYFSPFQTCVRANVGRPYYGDHGPIVNKVEAETACSRR